VFGFPQWVVGHVPSRGVWSRDLGLAGQPWNARRARTRAAELWWQQRSQVRGKVVGISNKAVWGSYTDGLSGIPSEWKNSSPFSALWWSLEVGECGRCLNKPVGLVCRSCNQFYGLPPPARAGVLGFDGELASTGRRWKTSYCAASGSGGAVRPLVSCSGCNRKEWRGEVGSDAGWCVGRCNLLKISTSVAKVRLPTSFAFGRVIWMHSMHLFFNLRGRRPSFGVAVAFNDDDPPSGIVPGVVAAGRRWHQIEDDENPVLDCVPFLLFRVQNANVKDHCVIFFSLKGPDVICTDNVV